MRDWRHWWFLALAWLGCGLPCVQAAILDVPTPYSTIQTALDATQDGDTVRVAPGVYVEHLEGPMHAVSLFSQYPFTEDSSDIVDTVLDGNLSGTILKVWAANPDSLVVNGLQFTRGRGQYVHGLEFQGGAVHVEPDADVVIRNCIFRDNQVDRIYQPSILMAGVMDFTRSNILMENVSIIDNNLTQQFVEYKQLIEITTDGNVELNRIRVYNTSLGYTGGINITAGGECAYSDMRICNANGFWAWLFSDESARFGEVEICSSNLVSMQIHARDMVASNLNFHHLHMDHRQVISIGADSCLHADHVTMQHCVSNEGIEDESPSYQLLSIGCSNDSTYHDSVLRHFVFVNNLAGDTLARPNYSGKPQMVDIINVSVEDAVISDNVMHLVADPLNEDGYLGNAEDGVLFRYSLYYGLLDARLKRCRFENNLLVDHDVYPLVQPDHVPANNGRSLYAYCVDGPAGTLSTPSVEFSDLIFRNNRQPNHVPEAYDLGIQVGFDVLIIADSDDMDFTMRNVVMEDIDDGGMWVHGNTATFDVQNVVINRVNRAGAMFISDCPEVNSVKNVLINESMEQDNYQYYPYTWSTQFAYGCGESTRTENLTITDCDYINLIRTAYGPVNCIESGNQFQYFCNPHTVIDDSPVFNYWYGSLGLNGTGNIMGSDPQFDSMLGAPFLMQDSPCIDAGNPSSVYNDQEDPDHPGFPLWPAQGTLRNDMGFTGGPYTAVPDTGWVDLPRPYKPKALPVAFTLGAPWPNPFNPVTRIPFTLTRPEIVKLSVHNLLGQEVAMLVHGVQFAGRHEVPWDAGSLASGIYVVHLEVGGKTESRAITLLR